METISTYSDQIMIWVVTYGTKVLGAILVFIIGLYVTNWIARLVSRAMSKRNFDISLQSFLGSMVGVREWEMVWSLCPSDLRFIRGLLGSLLLPSRKIQSAFEENDIASPVPSRIVINK